jgi:hypothetical protein
MTGFSPKVALPMAIMGFGFVLGFVWLCFPFDPNAKPDLKDLPYCTPPEIGFDWL